jgi:AraC-like DNA-binding protein
LYLAIHEPERTGLARLGDLIGDGEAGIQFLRPHYRKALAIRQAARAFFGPPSMDSGEWPDALFMSLAEQITTTLVRDAVGSAVPLGNDDPGTARKLQMVKRATHLMRTRHRKVASLMELCRAAFASPRALEYAFKAIYQTSPIAYYRGLRFSAARKELLLASAEKTSVTCVAQRFGFWHFGRFSTDYRARFRERPSETLARSYQPPHPAVAAHRAPARLTPA